MSLPRGRPWSRFLTLTRPLFRSEVRWQAVGLLALLFTILLSINGLNVVNNFVGGTFMTAIEQRQAARFAAFALIYVCVFAASTVVAVAARYVEERSGLFWRDWLTRHLVDKYLARRSYYRMNGRQDIDNPDQRIAEDVRTFTTTALSFFLIAINSTITLFSFSGILWSITPWLFVAASLYAALGSLTIVLLGRRLIPLDVCQLKKEADLRYELIRVRAHAEPIALLQGEANEKVRIGRRLQKVVDNMKSIINLNRNIGFFTNGYNYLIQLIPALIVAPLYIRGQVEFGKVTQAAMAFSFVMNAFSLIVQQFQMISSFGAVIERLGTAWEAIEEEEPAACKPALEVVADQSRIEFERLTLVTPGDGRLLVRELSVPVPPGRRLLIQGPNSAGRTALLRATAGLWTAGTGRLLRPPLEEMRFLPKQPYLTAGSLREQFLYGVGKDGRRDERILAVLRQVKLEEFLEQQGGLDAEQDWGRLLSLGEQQQIALARLLLANPSFAVLEEATSGLEPSLGHDLYDHLSRTSITYVSLAADPRLAEYHDHVLLLCEDGDWETAPRKSGESSPRVYHPEERAVLAYSQELASGAASA